MSNSAGGEFSKTPIPLISPPALHDIFVLLNLAEAVSVAVSCLTPSGVRVFGEICTSPPDNPFQHNVHCVTAVQKIGRLLLVDW